MSINALHHTDLMEGLYGPSQLPDRTDTSLIDDRLGWRIGEWCKLTGFSQPTVWRQINRGDLQVVQIGPSKMIPRREAIRIGLIDN